jgi:hypothetical protein
MVAFTDRLSVPAHVMVRVLDHEGVFLNLDTERYISLDPTATRMAASDGCPCDRRRVL